MATRSIVPAFLFTLLASLVGPAAQALGPGEMPADINTLEIGDKAPDFSLPGVDGETYTLADFSEPEILMVLFTGTHCPTSHSIEGRLQTLLDDMAGEDFGIVAINPNHPEGLREDEYGYSLYDETFEDSKRYAEELGWEFPFLYDGETQQTARAYGCLATPHVFIFDEDRRLRYKGRFDDSRFPDPDTVKHPDARNALEALLAGEPVPVEVTRPHGCSTKWRERSAHVVQAAERLSEIEATIEEIDAAGVAKLRQNGTDKLRLINVWATWCAPCVQEFPDLVAIQRKFSLRPFELITISLDAPSDRDKARAFLDKQRAVLAGRVARSVQEEGRSTNNYLYTGASVDELAEVLDPEWPGPIPFSILIDQDGKVLYRRLGMIDPEAVKAKVVEVMGTTY